MKALVFAYHNVGVRCLQVLRSAGVDIGLVVTHADNPQETIWFERVADLCRDYAIPWITPADANTVELVAQYQALAPDFIFSFYYRQMLSAEVLQIPRHGALNMHGSLLPQYRGRAPVNWMLVHGETQAGASLHYMTVKPDAGDLVAQFAVPILADDSAKEVFDKVTVAAELCLVQALPDLLQGKAARQPLDLSQGRYFGGRRPADGLIDWQCSPQQIHNLVRAVAPPHYPGAFFELALNGQRHKIRLWKTTLENNPPRHFEKATIYCENGRVFIGSARGSLRVIRADIQSVPAIGPPLGLDALNFVATLGSDVLTLG